MAERFAALLADRLGDRLVSIVLYGSVAREEARPDSDIDLFVVARDLPREYRRYDVWSELNAALGHPGLSVLLRTPEEAAVTRPLYLDLTEDAVLILDRDGFFGGVLDRLRARMRQLGSIRHLWQGYRYWELAPGHAPGEIIEL
ncbi:MAG: nucleotidyltransferase domain-containing protein [Deltaproteobacteria bacterium]